MGCADLQLCAVFSRNSAGEEFVCFAVEAVGSGRDE
jgi:hypothetical protein